MKYLFAAIVFLSSLSSSFATTPSIGLNVVWTSNQQKFGAVVIGAGQKFAGVIVGSGPPTSIRVFSPDGSFTVSNVPNDDSGNTNGSWAPAASVSTGALSLTAPDQVFSGGANITPYPIGTVSSGTTTIDCGKSPLQYLTDGGAFTLTAPANDGSCIILITNNGSAGAIAFLGFLVGSGTGDTLDTTNAHQFSVSVWRINGIAGYRIVAHQ